MSRKNIFLFLDWSICLILRLETLASHRAQVISTLLANALAFGYAEIYPENEPLKVSLHTPNAGNDTDTVDAESGYRHASRPARYSPPIVHWGLWGSVCAPRTHADSPSDSLGGSRLPPVHH